VEARGQVVAKSALMDAAWPNTSVEESNLTVQIAALRRRLNVSPGGEKWIATFPRVGYRFAGARAAQATHAGPALGPEPSIAVLPFTNMSLDPEQVHFADGLVDDLITDLSKVPGLLVIASHSSFAYRGRPADLPSVASELGVRYIIEGSVRRAAGRVRIGVHLTEAAMNRCVWAERFDGDLADVFPLQDEVVGKVVAALANVLPLDSRPDGAALTRRRAQNIEAYDFLVRGRVFVMHSPSGNNLARTLLAKAIELDPNLAEAHACLAISHHSAAINFGEEVEANRSLGLTYAQKAVSLDPGDPCAHGALGYVRLYEGLLEEAELAFQTALRINPNHANTLANMVALRVLQGLPDDAIALADNALRLNPYPPGWYYWDLGFAYYAAGRYAEAVDVLRKEEVGRLPAKRILAASLAQLGLVAEAREEACRFLDINPGFLASRWAETQPFRREGDRQHFVDGYVKAGLPL
jgi:TolB-like protein/tetratricopeptide (TPR) repeat protein